MLLSGGPFIFDWHNVHLSDHRGLWITSFFRHIAISFLDVYSIIFIYSLGTHHLFEGGVKNGLLLVLVYLSLAHFVIFSSIIWLGNLVIRKVGYRRSIVLSLVFTSWCFISLSIADITQQLLWILIAALSTAIGMCLYWSTYYTLFTDDTDSKHIGRAYALLEAFAKVGQIMAPILGAIIIGTLGFSYLFWIGVFFLSISGLPMLFLKSHKHTDEISWSELIKWLREWRFLKFSLAAGGHSIQEKLHVSLWPIFLLTVIGSIRGLDSFRTLILASSTIFTFVIAKLFDKKADRRFLVVGGIGSIAMWFFRSVATVFSQIFILEIADSLFRALSRTFFLGYMFRRAQGKQSFSFIVYYLLSESFWYLICLLLLILILVFFGVAWMWVGVIGLGTTGMAISLLVKEDK